MARFAVAHTDEIEEMSDGRCPYRPVRMHFGITTFGATLWTAPAAGDRLINEHDESEPDSGDELYLVTDGHAAFELDGVEHDAPAGTFVHAGPGVTRTAFALQPGTTVFAVGGAPEGQVYETANWERWAPLFGLFRQGRYDEMIEQARPYLAPEPEFAELYYNVACAECLADRPDDAVAHLATAIQLKRSLAERPCSDDDFAAIRDRPEFAQMHEA